MVAEKNISSNAEHNFAKFTVISKYKNDKPWKKLDGKSASPPLFKNTCLCTILPHLFARCILVIGSTLFETTNISGSRR